MKSHLPRLRKRPSSCFCFVLNHVVLTGSLPFELIPGHFIDRANDMEAEQIRNALREYPFLSHRAYAYEFDRRDGTYSKRLTSKNWRYWVVRLSSPDDERIDDLQHALNLHQASLELGMMFSPHGVTSRVLELIQFYFEPDHWMPNSPAVPVSAFEGIRNVCEMVLTVTQAHPELGRILADFELLKCLPRASR